MGWFKRLFGSGTIRVEITMVDGTTGIAKVPYEGDILSMTHDDTFRFIKNYCYVHEGLFVNRIKVLGYTQD